MAVLQGEERAWATEEDGVSLSVEEEVHRLREERLSSELDGERLQEVDLQPVPEVHPRALFTTAVAQHVDATPDTAGTPAGPKVDMVAGGLRAFSTIPAEEVLRVPRKGGASQIPCLWSR
jgi:hypothetical protein